MKKVSKGTKIITTLVLLVLAFLCSLNVTISYFTATSSLPGELVFGGLDVRFCAVGKDTKNDASVELPNNQEDYTQNNLYTIMVSPLLDYIPRGQSFEFSYDIEGFELERLIIRNMDGSCNAYVRFWVDAFVKTGNTLGTTNYGQYFTFDDIDNREVVKGGVGKNIGTEADSCYFVTFIMDDKSVVKLGNSLVLSEDIPDDVLGCQLQISISLEAIQAENGAYLTESGFNDEKGYCSEWGEND